MNLIRMLIVIIGLMVAGCANDRSEILESFETFIEADSKKEEAYQAYFEAEPDSPGVKLQRASTQSFRKRIEKARAYVASKKGAQ